MNETGALIRRGFASSLCFPPHEEILSYMRRKLFTSQEGAFTRHWICLYLDLEFPSPEKCAK